MRVNIDEIKEAGLQRSWDVPREQLDEMLAGDRAGYRARGPAHVEVKLEKIERRVRIGARAKADVTAECGRCLTPVSVEGPVGGSFAPKAADEETYTGKVIDLDPIVREQILLAVPGYPVCEEGCKGLCSVCGANLNERDCGCDRHVPDPRWAGLKNIKL